MDVCRDVISVFMYTFIFLRLKLKVHVNQYLDSGLIILLLPYYVLYVFLYYK